MILGTIASSVLNAGQVEGNAAVRAAITASVQARAGVNATVDLDLQVVEVAPGAALDTADPEPGARFGRPSRFRLRAGSRTVGYAVVVVHASLPHLRLTRAVNVNVPLTADDVREVTGDPGPLTIEALPGLEAVIGSSSVRLISADEVVTARMVRAAPAVRSGDVVAVRVVVDGVEAVGVATALQSGNVGDTIRLVNAESRRQLRGRITGKSAVEVQHES